MGRGIPTGAGVIGLDHWPQRADRYASGANAAETRRHAAELAALAPDVILAHGSSTVGPLLQATRTVPIVFPIAADPVGANLNTAKALGLDVPATLLARADEVIE